MAELARPAYDPDLRERDRAFVLKKLGLSPAEFDAMMAAPPRAHREFDHERSIYERYPLLVPARGILGYAQRRLAGA